MKTGYRAKSLTLTGAVAMGTGALLIYKSDPVVLVDQLLKTHTERHYHQPSCFCTEALSQEE